MSQIRIFLVCLLAFVAVGCKAQSATSSSTLDAKTTRMIDVTLRSKLGIPPDYVIQVGPRTPSQTPGFSTIRVTFLLPDHPDHTQALDFLISDDNKTLERVSHWDISGNPADLVPFAGRPVRGNPSAKVIIVNFDDLECPYCAKLHSELFPDTLDHYKGLIKIVYHDLPLIELHPWAMHAAVNANCLAAQSPIAYWSYVDYLHTHGEDVTGPDRDPKKSDAMLDKLALDQGAKDKLDATTLGACITKQDESSIREEMKLADSLGINQTPTLFVNGEIVSGALPTSILWDTIDRALVSEGITPPPRPDKTPATNPAAGTKAAAN